MNKINRCKPLLGTYVEIDISGQYSDDILLQTSQKIFSRIEEIENLMSFYDPLSELSYLNSNAHRQTCTISDEMAEILNQALQISQLTDGIYDISIGNQLIKNGFLPDNGFGASDNSSFKDIFLVGNKVKFAKKMQLDLGGIAKGYAVDQALLAAEGLDVQIIINAGGDLAMNNWNEEFVDIKIPSLKNNKTIKIKMQNKAVATSSSYYFDQDKNPIICPKTHKMVNDKRSVSVFAPSCMIADALTKVAFLDENCSSLMQSLGAKALFIDEQGNFC
ncbi:MAG: thiamine biosynthesis lipoprotein [Myxococcota bacterium]|jgi:thiamine biosynthesis lipoprotein